MTPGSLRRRVVNAAPLRRAAGCARGAGRPAVAALIRIGLRRYAVGMASAAGHAAALLAVLYLTSTAAPRHPPPEPIAVEIVPADEQPEPRIEGTPLESTSNGSEMASESKEGSATTGPPRPKMTALPSLEQQAAGQPAAGSPLVAPPGETMPLPPQSPDQAATQPQDAPQPLPDAMQRFAMPMMLPGAKVPSGFDAPSNAPAMLQHDDTAAFRARLSACSRSLSQYRLDEHTVIRVTVSFKRNGTLASEPQVQSSLSADAVELTKIAVTALKRCQPYPELPADKYARWKTLDLVVTPLGLTD